MPTANIACVMRISDVARHSGVATALRYYESVGLIEAGRAAYGYRSYDPDVFGRLSFIEAAKQLDLPLSEIAELLMVVEGDTCTRVRDALHSKLQQRLRDVDARLAALDQLRERLAAAPDKVVACPDAGRSCRSERMLGSWAVGISSEQATRCMR